VLCPGYWRRHVSKNKAAKRRIKKNEGVVMHATNPVRLDVSSYVLRYSSVTVGHGRKSLQLCVSGLDEETLGKLRDALSAHAPAVLRYPLEDVKIMLIKVARNPGGDAVIGGTVLEAIGRRNGHG
jgi:hypothetical protein